MSRRITNSTPKKDIQGTFGQINKQAEENFAQTRLRETEARQIQLRVMKKEQELIESDSEDCLSERKSSILLTAFELDTAYDETMMKLNEGITEKELINYQKRISEEMIWNLQEQVEYANKTTISVNKELVEARLGSNALLNRLNYYSELIERREKLISSFSHLLKMHSCEAEDCQNVTPLTLLTLNLSSRLEDYFGRNGGQNFEDKISALIREIEDLHVVVRHQKLQTESRRIEKESEILQAVQKKEESYAKALEEIKVEGTGQISTLKLKIDSFCYEIESLKALISRMENQVESLKSRYNEVDSAQEALRLESRSLKSELGKLTSSLDELTVVNSVMRGRVEKLRKVGRNL